MASTARILLVGSCSGNVSVLMKRLQTVSDKSGPFDAAFCVGPFFPDDGTDDGPTSEELSEYLRGDKQSPVSTYFIGGFGTGSQVGLSQASPSKSNVRYLGRCGLVRVKGLTVAFLDGTHSNKEFRSSAEAHQGLGCRHYTEGDMQSLKRTVNSADGDVDLLLTCEWPRGIVDGLPDVPVEAKHPSRSSYGIAELALAVRPRYHVAASKELFYARMPYLNQDLGAGAHVTRFVGLGAVGNQAKQKWLHALQLTPAAYMDQEAMLTKPSDTTPCPFEGLGLGSRKRGMAQDDEQDLGFAHVRWRGLGKKGRYEGRVSAAPSFGRPDVVTDKRKSVFVNNISFKAEESDLVQFFAQAGKVVDVRRTLNSFGKLNGYAFIQFETVEEMQRACQLSGMKLMGREMRVDPSVARDKACIAMGTAVADCWFCLSNPNADVHLVISVGEESYLAVDKGAINDTHCLVLPIDHYPSLASLPASCFLEMHRFVNALRSCVAAQGMVVVGFERFLSFKNRGGNHSHVNLVGVPRAQGGKAAALFEKKLGEAGMSCQTLPSLEGRAAQKAIQDVVGDGEYFLALLPDSSILVHPLLRGEKLPMNLGREVLAELAECPDRADWHVCEESREIQVARAESFKSSFGDHDIMAS